jgi:hypothetical protein
LSILAGELDSRLDLGIGVFIAPHGIEDNSHRDSLSIMTWQVKGIKKQTVFYLILYQDLGLS